MRVSIIDYGLSNLLSVSRAVEKLGHQPQLAHTGAEVREADVLILPGVGAFSDGMAGLMQRDMLATIWGCAESGVLILGICLGMQMLFESSHENGIHRGLGLIPGHVEPIPNYIVDGSKLRVPHIGWESLLLPKGRSDHDAFMGQHTRCGDEVYFVHSFAAKPKQPSHVLAECEYGGHRVCAMVRNNNVVGTQFHPEKSGPVGLRILESFMQQASSSKGKSA